MRCPFCGADETRVVDSRLGGEGDQIRRRRECTACKGRFTTYETVELNLPRVIKSNGSREPFDEAKLRSGISRALEKRPVATEAVEEAISHIKRRLMEFGDRELNSQVLGEWVMQELRSMDQVAYVRFASVYRSFEDVQAFREEVERLEAELSPEQRKRQIPLIPDD